MKYTKTTAKKMMSYYSIDIAEITTVNNLLAAMAEDTYKVVMEAALGEPEVHFIETRDDEILVFITDENDPTKIIEIYFE